jgi:hypothetical protein
MTIELAAGTLRRREHTFYLAMAVSMAVVVFIGFSRTFFFRFWFPEVQSLAAPEVIFLVHGVFFTSWIAFLVLQSSLIKTGRVQQHRKLGWLGVALAVCVVLLGVYGALVAAQRPGGFIGAPAPPQQFLIVPLADMVLFGLFVSLAVAWRRNSGSHKRLMLLATINLLAAAFVRFPFDFIISGAPFTSFGLSDLFIVAMVVWDLRSSRKLHAVTLWAGLLTILSQPLRLMIADTQAWLEFAGWAVGILN